MTNEELVKLIQDGQAEYIPQLWDQVYLFICRIAKKRLIGETEYIKQLEDDLVNEAYFDFMKAVEDYKFDQEAGFLNYLTYHLKKSFNRVLGLRTSKDKNDVMHHIASLDAPVNDTADITLQDMVIDHIAEEDYRLIEQEDFWKDVHALLQKAINNSMESETKCLFMTMLDYNCGFTDACKVIEVSEENKSSMLSCYNNGLRNIRRYILVRAKKQFKELGIDEYLSIGLRSTGLMAYRNHGFTSSTESAAVRLADADSWKRNIMEIFD